VRPSARPHFDPLARWRNTGWVRKIGACDGPGRAREGQGEHVRENLRQVLHQIAQDARAEGRFSHADLRAPGRPIDVNANVRTDTEQASFGAFVVASDWHRKLLSRTPGNWTDPQKHDFVGVALSSAFAIFATELLHYESGIKDQGLLDQSVANIFHDLKLTYPETKLREVWELAFGLKKSLRSSSEPNAIKMRENLAQLVLNDALNRVSNRLAAEKIEMPLFGLYDTFRRAIAPAASM
jgi:hypothetical protein